MPKLQAKVPKGVPPNALLRVRLPDGTEVNVRVPEGLSEGQEFIFEVDSMEGLTTSSVKTSAAAEASVEGSNSNKQAAKKDSSLNKFSNKQAKKKNNLPDTGLMAPRTRANKAHRVKQPPHYCPRILAPAIHSILEFQWTARTDSEHFGNSG